jgi:FtsZ-binding cell division protein ZapB
MNWKPVVVFCGIVMGLTTFRAFPATTAEKDLSLLTSCYFRFLVAEQVSAQVAALTKDQPADAAGQIKKCAGTWYDRQLDALRADLEAGLGDQAQAQFEKFVGDFLQAEKAADNSRLVQLSESLQLKSTPSDYPAFRKTVMDTAISKDMTEACRFLSEIQTWIDMRGKNRETPSLDIWLSRTAESKRTATSLSSRPKEKKPSRNLAEAEAATPDLPEADSEEASNPLESFAAKRQEKRDKVLADAEAGMQQVAAERQAAEEEYAAKKLAAAQAEAENMKQHAEKLAATEKDALEQRKNSWGNRLKSIIGATVSAATGAFTGGIGARAGEEAVNAVFGDHHH